LKDILDSLLKNGRMTSLAYDSIASNPEDDVEVYTYTASGGKICGILSACPSYTRLSTGISFQKVYIVRLDGPLANGDCGSAVIDAKTGGTYGHLIAGCRTTGTAYILAADQVAEDVVEALPKESAAKQRPMNAPSCDSLSPSPLRELQGPGTHQSEAEYTPVDISANRTADPQNIPLIHDRKHLRNMHYEYPKRSDSERRHRASKAYRKSWNAPQKTRRTKRWRPVFAMKRPFEDSLFFEARESIAGFERVGGPLDAFLEDADSSIPSWETTVIREFLQNRTPPSGLVQELARARLDDREYSTGYKRGNPEWLTSNGLRDHLTLPVRLLHALRT
jgi:hypothetical protein